MGPFFNSSETKKTASSQDAIKVCHWWIGRSFGKAQSSSGSFAQYVPIKRSSRLVLQKHLEIKVPSRLEAFVKKESSCKMTACRRAWVQIDGLRKDFVIDSFFCKMWKTCITFEKA